MVSCIKNYLAKNARPGKHNGGLTGRYLARYIKSVVSVLFPLIIVVMTPIHFAHSEQISFNKTPLENDVQLSYKWRDHANEKHQFSFTLPLEQVKNRHHKRFVPEQVTRYQQIAMLKERNKIDAKDARIEIKRIGESLQLSVRSRSEEQVKKYQKQLLQAKDDAFEQYLEDHYYTQFSNYLGQEGIKPDHLRYIKENQTLLKPFAEAMYAEASESPDMRAFLNLLLGWLQSIPYDDLESRVSSNGAGFSPPFTLLSNNQGDCDSKSVLMASVIRALFPDIELVMLYLPNHALLGIAMSPQKDEASMLINGEEYLLMEPTGPALFSLNEVAPSSQRFLDTRMYSYEVIP
ncbi:hypothetical protein [Paraglaciecola chathamensis]|uniref:Transglutaminase-like domain-containing protein n=1 Tax=Paraglaciecola chathamensis S18K6 TaxID=1127672 RepID=A0AAV3UUD1_9ALTE|nr:hypothetical protein [Paraglaciecola chathamensis]GAC08666.1 hypothetical protein GCHA_0703 [Paraglaciecola chathamensis S18K6]